MRRNYSNIKIRHRLLTRLLLSYVLIVALPLLLIGRILVNTAQDAIEETIRDRNLEFARRTTNVIDLEISNAKRLLRTMSKIQARYPMNRMTQEIVLNELVTEHPIYNRLSILDSLGQIVASTSFDRQISERLGQNGQLNEVLQEVRGGNAYQTEVYVLQSESLPLLDIVEPIEIYNEVVGVLYAVVELRAMWDIVDQNVVGERGEAFVFDKNGRYIAHSDRKQVYQKSRYQNKEILQWVRQDSTGQTIYMSDEQETMIAAFAPIPGIGWTTMLQQPTSEAFAPAARMRLRVIQFMIASVLIASILAYFYTRDIVTPVNRLVSGMDAFSKGELSHRIENIGADEIGMLAQQFNRMAERLLEFQETVKRTERLETLGKLASVLSHEIRNPLNSMVINMQILKRELSKRTINKERVERFFDILASEIKRVDQLVTDFLQVAKPPMLEMTTIKLDTILNEVLTLHVADSLQKGIRVERLYQDKDVEVKVDAGRMRQVFLNLIINAIQAMPGGGRLSIDVDDSGDEGVRVCFEDSGHGIEESDLRKIFDFYYSTKEDGSGLGLAIVQQIVEEHHGRVIVESEVQKGSRFIIELPLPDAEPAA